MLPRRAVLSAKAFERRVIWSCVLILTEKGIKSLHHGDLLHSIADNSLSLKSLNLSLLVNLCDWKQSEEKWNEKEKTGQALFLDQVGDMIRHTM